MRTLIVRVTVYNNNYEQACKTLNRKIHKEGLQREQKERKTFVKPSIKRLRKREEAIKRRKKFGANAM